MPRTGGLRERRFEGGAVLAERQLPSREALIYCREDLAAVFFRDMNLGRGNSHLPPLHLGWSQREMKV
jgi:hypothetical protein